MTFHPIFLLGLLGAGALVATQSKPAVPGTGGAPNILQAKAGETWMLTCRAVGAKIGPLDEQMIRAQMPVIGALQSLVISDSGDTMVLVLTYKQDTRIVVNQLIALTTSPNKGLMITEAKAIPDFPTGPVPPPEAPPPLQ